MFIGVLGAERKDLLWSYQGKIHSKRLLSKLNNIILGGLVNLHCCAGVVLMSASSLLQVHSPHLYHLFDYDLDVSITGYWRIICCCCHLTRVSQASLLLTGGIDSLAHIIFLTGVLISSGWIWLKVPCSVSLTC